MTLTTKLLIGSFGKRSSGQSTPRRLTNQNTPASSIGSLQDNKGTNSDQNSSDELIVSKTTQRKFKVRHAVIADADDLPKEKTSTMTINLEGNKDHLETKKQIESLRKQYGDGWLHSQGASMVHSVLGIENERVEKPISSEQMIQSLLEETNGIDKPTTHFLAASTPIGSYKANETVLDASVSQLNIEVNIRSFLCCLTYFTSSFKTKSILHDMLTK